MILQCTFNQWSVFPPLKQSSFLYQVLGSFCFTPHFLLQSSAICILSRIFFPGHTPSQGLRRASSRLTTIRLCFLTYLLNWIALPTYLLHWIVKTERLFMRHRRIIISLSLISSKFATITSTLCSMVQWRLRSVRNVKWCLVFSLEIGSQVSPVENFYQRIMFQTKVNFFCQIGVFLHASKTCQKHIDKLKRSNMTFLRSYKIKGFRENEFSCSNCS